MMTGKDKGSKTGNRELKMTILVTMLWLAFYGAGTWYQG